MTLRIGIAGANPERGWARDAHLDALNALQDVQIEAVSARTREGADAAAEHFGAARAFGDSLEMVRDPAIDVVAVTVKVPEHRTIVLAALEAGKHVYCEWPLGRDLAEAQEMAAAVRPDMHVITGLQGLFAPAIRRAAELIGTGAIGSPRILRVFASAGAWGAEAPPHYAYLQDKRNGATLETIGGGHTLAAVEALVGEYREVDARNSILNPRIPVSGTSEMVERTCADHMFVLGLHESGCASFMEVIGGWSKRPALFEIQGDNGWLRVVGSVPGTYQIPRLELEASFALDPLPDPVAPDLSGPSVNVTEAWSAFSRDIAAGTRTVPDFARAVRLTRLLDAIDVASATGQRQLP